MSSFICTIILLDDNKIEPLSACEIFTADENVKT